MQDLDRQRELMVRDQLERRGIADRRVLEVMRKVKRHLFVPDDEQVYAYEDSPLPIGEGQTISQPYIVALMTEQLSLKGLEKVLEIGTGSGYQTAILAELAKEVFTVERIKSLADRVARSFQELGYQNVHVLCGDGFAGWPEHAPFDAIIVTCAPDEIPSALAEQLAEGGRMSIPVGSDLQELRFVRKVAGRLSVDGVAGVRFVPMVRGQKG